LPIFHFFPINVALQGIVVRISVKKDFRDSGRSLSPSSWARYAWDPPYMADILQTVIGVSFLPFEELFRIIFFILPLSMMEVKESTRQVISNVELLLDFRLFELKHCSACIEIPQTSFYWKAFVFFFAHFTFVEIMSLSPALKRKFLNPNFRYNYWEPFSVDIIWHFSGSGSILAKSRNKTNLCVEVTFWFSWDAD
jgi:hypothetical protein